jgi:hypothetical protein
MGNRFSVLYVKFTEAVCQGNGTPAVGAKVIVGFGPDDGWFRSRRSSGILRFAASAKLGFRFRERDF